MVKLTFRQDRMVLLLCRAKVNPVIPEVVSQVAFHVIGNDTAITMAAEAGQMELNAFEPVVFYSLLIPSILLKEAVETLTKELYTWNHSQ